MRAHYFQHVPFEGLGSIEEWLKDRGYAVGRSAFYEKDYAFPRVDEIDFLIVMGGPMSVNDEAAYPWLVEEKKFIRAYIERWQGQRPLLGICLGAQLIAAALGAEVYAGREKEIGWLEIENPDPEAPGGYHFPPSCTVFQWHGETFDLPPFARRLACSQSCENQAFQFGDKVIALQFHLETTPASARALVDNCRDELAAGAPRVQSEDRIMAAGPESYTALNREMTRLLDFLTEANNRGNNQGGKA